MKDSKWMARRKKDGIEERIGSQAEAVLRERKRGGGGGAELKRE